MDRSCAICGLTRTYAWSPFDFNNTAVERHYRVDNVLEAFTKWLLNFEADILGLDPTEKRRKRKHCNNNNNNNAAAAAFIEGEAEDGSEDEDAENNYMLGYDEGGEKPISAPTYAYAHAGKNLVEMAKIINYLKARATTMSTSLVRCLK